MPESVQPEGPIAGPGSFSARVVHWQTAHGRNDLPWQNTRDPYRVWLSEIMLQQTQVATVKAYFLRFLERFPDVASLAAASEDEVLGLWSGLGYYTRARNLHRCALAVVQQHGGIFPRDAAALQTLPGIGRSTAAAIASLCFSQRVAIMDANVRRVVSRVQAFGGDLTRAVHARALWDLADRLLPDAERAPSDMPAYTQGLMDLGASVCQPRQPRCDQCPVAPVCLAHAAGTAQDYPVRARKVKRSTESVWMLHVRNTQGDAFLTKRDATGIWAGLFCFPVYPSEDALRVALGPQWQDALTLQPVFTHVLTHRDLHLHPLHAVLPMSAQMNLPGQWVAASDWPALGLPAPVRRLLAGV